PEDAEFHAAIARQDSIVLVKGTRQVGKTSLLARGIQQAREAGARVVLTDFQMFNVSHLESAETLLMALAQTIAECWTCRYRRLKPGTLAAVPTQISAGISGVRSSPRRRPRSSGAWTR